MPWAGSSTGPMNRNTAIQGFTIAELMIAMGFSIVIIAALTLSAIQLQKSLYASETFASSYADQRRLIDYMARDLRRSISIAAVNPAGVQTPLTAQTVDIGDGTSLILKLPGYYKSDVPGNAEFDKALPVISSPNGVDYGTNAVRAPAVTVSFRKEMRPEEHSVCFVREEAGNTQVIVRRAEDLSLRVTMSGQGKSCTLAVSFTGSYSRAKPKVFTYDEVFLRNVRMDALP
jgi:hypothetical protein